jgi:hypothetical protein
MKLNILLFLMIFSACTVDKEKQQGSETTQDQGTKAAIVENKPQHSSVFLEKFTQKAIDIISTNQYVSFSDLQKQKLKNIEENSGVTVSTDIPPEMSGFFQTVIRNPNTNFSGSF